MEIKKLEEERIVVGNEMNSLTATIARDGGRNFTGEELTSFDKMEADFKSLSDKIETAKRIARSAEISNKSDPKAVVTSHRGTVVTRQDNELAFKAWALKASGKEQYLRREHLDAANKTGMNMNSDSLTVNLADNPNSNDVQRNQSSGINSEGGYLQNDGVFQSLERNMKWFAGARTIAKVLRTENGEPISYAYADDTASLGVRLGQNNTVANTNVVFQKKTLGEYTYTSGVYPISIQLLQDARIDVSSDIGEALGIRLARITNTDYTVGTGGAMPTGFMTDASAGVTAAGAAIGYNDLVGLLFSMDKAYRDHPSFCFTMSDATLAALWKLADTTNRPLFYNYNQSMVDGNGFTLLGKKIVVNNDMPAIATTKSPICAIVGDKFIIRDVKSTQLVVLRERFMDTLSVGMMAYLRTDSKLLNPNCAKKLTMP